MGVAVSEAQSRSVISYLRSFTAIHSIKLLGHRTFAPFLSRALRRYQELSSTSFRDALAWDFFLSIGKSGSFVPLVRLVGKLKPLLMPNEAPHSRK
jgi:hypothetical protein